MPRKETNEEPEEKEEEMQERGVSQEPHGGREYGRKEWSGLWSNERTGEEGAGKATGAGDTSSLAAWENKS